MSNGDTYFHIFFYFHKNARKEPQSKSWLKKSQYFPPMQHFQGTTTIFMKDFTC